MKASIVLCCALVGSGLAARSAAADLHLSYAGKTVALTAAEFAALPHETVTALDGHDKKDHTYSGVPVRDLLSRVDVPSGEKLRGKALSLIVVAHCLDGYQVVFALAEFDDAFNTRTIYLVDREDGQPLFQKTGPFRLLVPGDKRPARWAHKVSELDVVPVGG
jgi:hypothetical protein